MAIDVSRRNFVQGTAAVGGGLALGGPLSMLAAREAEGHRGHGHDPRVGYGELFPTPDEDSGVVYLELPKGFKYRVISTQADPMDDGNPTPGIFDGMAAYPGRYGTTILIRNHENRSRELEIPVVVPKSKRYDPDPNVRGGNTKLVVDRNRRVVESFAVIGGTHTNCAGGSTPWGTWITCEEIFNYGSVEDNDAPGTGVPHGFAFEVPANAKRAVDPQPIRAAGRFAREAVAWVRNALYQTEDRGDACLYRFIPDVRPREHGDLASNDGVLQALVVSGQPNFDANTANPGESYPVEWVDIEEPSPETDTLRVEAQSKGAAIFDRTEGAWEADGRLYFDCTTGGEAQLGQLWQYTPGYRGDGTLKLIYESTDAGTLENPDNVVVVPHTGDVFLQEDSAGEQFIRGVNRRGEIYDFARGVISTSEFCGGCFSPDGKTFFVNHQGDRVDVGPDPAPESAALTFAIWGPFDNDHRGWRD
jgi:secreted PhoX family phosphatase